MTNQNKPGANPGRKSISPARKPVARSFITLLLITLIMETTAGSANAQSTQTAATPGQMVDALHAAFGRHPNARAVHAKGIILEGDFTPTADAKSLTVAPHLQGKTIPVTFRFSDFTGIPDISDINGGSNPRGLAVKFHLPDGASTDIVGHSFNGFPTATTDQFRTLLLAISKSGPDAPKPTELDTFLSDHPIAKTFLTTQKPPSVSYGTLSYFGVNAFKFTNAEGKTQFIRYQFVPEAGEQFLTAEQLKTAGPNYLSEEIKERIAKGNIKFLFYAQIAEAGDKIDDPSIAWPDSRRRVLLGVLTIKKLAPNTMQEDKQLTFNPGNLPEGIEPADAMIIDRKKAYPVSVKERQ